MRRKSLRVYTVQASAYCGRRRVRVFVTKDFRVRQWKRAQTALRLLLEREGFKVERVCNFGQYWTTADRTKLGAMKPSLLVQAELNLD